jgi:two-component system, NarL family, sensor histidine kinase DesK
MTDLRDDRGRAAGEAGDRGLGAGEAVGRGLGAGEAGGRGLGAGAGRRPRFLRYLPFGGYPLDARNPSGIRAVAAIVWLTFIVFPLVNAFGKKGTTLEDILVIAGAASFVGCYVVLVVHWRGTPRTPMPLLIFALMLAISSALTIWQASGWGFLFTYCATCAALVGSAGFWGVVACTVLAGGCTAIGGADGGTVIGYVASSAGVGMLMLVMRDLRVRNLELNEARAELANMAVAEERERFARDLHDLLGHSLSVIALKAELAGRLLADAPTEAAREVSELEQVARTALGEVREAVSGYRQPTLDGELAGARMALSAAGIEANVQESHVALDPPVEAVLAWAVREGATNVIRHSGARHCTLRITTSLTDAGAEVIDDGRGAAANGNGAGGVPGGGGGGGGVPDGAGVPGGAGVRGAAGVPGGAGVPGAAGVPGGTGVPGGPGVPGGAAVSTRAGTEYARAGAEYARAGAVRLGGGGAGHGLAGLAERARLLNGWIEAGTLSGGGYRLAVTVPVSHA